MHTPSNSSKTHIALIGGKKITYHFEGNLSELPDLYPGRRFILLSEEYVWNLLPESLKKGPSIVFPSGESHKNQQTADQIIKELIRLRADKESILIGIGGGVVTDLAGYVASTYMRGMGLGLVPTTLLAMVDAAIGGKNGVDVEGHKNMVGTIYQPGFVLFDPSLLKTLPEPEWASGFAEIIKHACIADAELFSELQQHNTDHYRQSPDALSALVKRNVLIKTAIVREDEQGNGKRHLLNFGHTLGHPIEIMAGLPHGHAVAAGMMLAAGISEEINGFSSLEKKSLGILIEQYGLPVFVKTDVAKLIGLAVMDKKKSGDSIRFVLLQQIGQAVTKHIPIPQLTDLVRNLFV